MHALVRGGADVIELGVPFSDPMADGPTIQRSRERALKHGTSLKMILGFVREFRATDATTPVVLMGYANPIEAMGQETFADRCAESGVDGVLVVDYPPEECAGTGRSCWRHAASIPFSCSRRPRPSPAWTRSRAWLAATSTTFR